MMHTAVFSISSFFFRARVALVVTLLLALLLRTTYLETAPRGLQADEASFLINATALLETGRDEDNRRFPLYLHSLIDSKPALYAYLQVPFIAVLGPTTEASRLPGALLGTGSIILLYLLARRILKNEWLAITAAFLLAVSPWHVMNSRATQEVIMSSFFLLGNLILWYDLSTAKSLSKTKLLLFFLTALAAMYSYHALKIIMVGVYGGVLIAQASAFAATRLKLVTALSITKAELFRSLLLSAVIAFGFILTASAALTRFSAIGLLSDDLPKAQIFEVTTLTTGQTPLALVRLYYNKPVFYFHRFIEQYAAHFDPNFLFVTGGATRRFSVPYHGLFYLVDALLLVLGAHHLVTQKKYRRLLLPIGLLLVLSPIPAALTTEELPSSIRSFTLLLPMLLLMVLGFEKLWGIPNVFVRRSVFSLLALCYVWSAGFFMQQFFVAMPVLNTEARSRHYEQFATVVAADPERFGSISFTNDLREMYIYLWKSGLISIAEIQAEPLGRYRESYQLGGFLFSQASCIPDEGMVSETLVSPSACEKTQHSQLSVSEQITFENKTPALSIFTTKGQQ